MLDDEVVLQLLDHGTVRSADGQVLGRVGQLFRSDSDGEATWVSIDSGQSSDALQTLVPMAGSTVDGHDLQVAYPADAVVGAPQVAVGAAVSGDDERRVREFYAMDAVAGDPDPGVDQQNTAAPATDADELPSADEAAPVTDVLSVVRSEEELAVGTQWVPVRRARLEKFQVTETRTIEVEWTREEVRVVYEPLAEGAAAEIAPATEPRPWVLMEERIVVTKEWVPAQSVRLVVDRVAGEQIVSEPVRKERVELQMVDPVDDAATSD